jgi:hypothetical protein
MAHRAAATFHTVARIALSMGATSSLGDENGNLQVDLLFTDRGDVVNGTASRFHPAQAREHPRR